MGVCLPNHSNVIRLSLFYPLQLRLFQKREKRSENKCVTFWQARPKYLNFCQLEKSKDNKQQMKEEIQSMGVLSNSPRPSPLDEKGAGTLIRWRGCVKAKRWISKCAWDGVITGRRTRESKRYSGGEKDWEGERWNHPVNLSRASPK